ncbi:hypothetical protein DENSPDRAFT_505762 [Dentipellis sp. KUC8613]|nr:hypothetical protein DENSPDRAFT_505762 [Dentipellis sp. KUC8613]
MKAVRRRRARADGDSGGGSERQKQKHGLFNLDQASNFTRQVNGVAIWELLLSMPVLGLRSDDLILRVSTRLIPASGTRWRNWRLGPREEVKVQNVQHDHRAAIGLPVPACSHPCSSMAYHLTRCPPSAFPRVLARVSCPMCRAALALSPPPAIFRCLPCSLAAPCNPVQTPVAWLQHHASIRKGARVAALRRLFDYLSPTRSCTTHVHETHKTVPRIYLTGKSWV